MFKIQFDANGRFRIVRFDAGSEYGLLPKAETVYCLSEHGIEMGEPDHSFEYIDSATGKDYKVG
jgi:hypothetical protein